MTNAVIIPPTTVKNTAVTGKPTAQYELKVTGWSAAVENKGSTYHKPLGEKIYTTLPCMKKDCQKVQPNKSQYQMKDQYKHVMQVSLQHTNSTSQAIKQDILTANHVVMCVLHSVKVGLVLVFSPL